MANDLWRRVTGTWEVSWVRTMSSRAVGTLEVSVVDDRLVAELDTNFGTAVADAEFDGGTLSWSTSLAGEEVRFAAAVDGDEFLGTATLGYRVPVVGTTFSLRGVRPESGLPVRRIGSDALGDSLRECGIEYVFGAPGSRWMPSPEHGIRSMAVRTEIDAAWISYGYNRARGRAASAASLWGVGALHASPVVYAAKQDTTPLLFLGWEQSTVWDMRHILQESTQLYASLEPVSKYAKRVVDVEDIPLAVRQATLAASTGKHGPSVLSITDAVLYDWTAIPSEPLVLPAPPAARRQDVDAVVEAIGAAKRPVLLVGGGVHMARATAELREFAETAGIPVVSSAVGGRGALPDDHPLYAGDTWRGFPTGIKVAEEADLWISVGFSYSQASTHWWSLKKPANVIQVDIEPNQIGRIFQPTLGIVADAKVFLEQLTERLRDSGATRTDSFDDPRIAEIQSTKAAYLEVLGELVDEASPRVPAIGQIFTRELPDDSMIVVDDGRIMAGMVYTEEKYPNGFAAAMGYNYACMGSALPVAIGAKLADPDRTVICYGGDGGFYYECGELALLAQHGIKVIVIINNNSGLYGGDRGGFPMATAFGGNPHNSYSAANLAEVASGFGVESERVDTIDGFTQALRRALAADGPYFIELLSEDTNVVLDRPRHLEPLMERVGIRFPPKAGQGVRTVEGSWPS